MEIEHPISLADTYGDGRRADEFVDDLERLHVPVANRMDKAPAREGWTPYWVNVNLSDPIQKVVLYKRTPCEETISGEHEWVFYMEGEGRYCQWCETDEMGRSRF